MKVTNTYKSRKEIENDMIFDIQNEEGISLKVVVNNKATKIYKKENIRANKYDLIEKILHFQGLYTGFDASPYELHGTSILVVVNKKRYIFLGDEMFVFSTKEPIIDFITPMATNGIPYPIAYTNNYIYFFPERIFFEKSLIETPTIANSKNIYCMIYNNSGNNINKKQIKDIEVIKMIHESL